MPAWSVSDGSHALEAGASQSTGPASTVTNPVSRVRRIVLKKRVPVRTESVPRRVTGIRAKAPRQPQASSTATGAPVASIARSIAAAAPSFATQRPCRPSKATVVRSGCARSACSSSPRPRRNERRNVRPTISSPREKLPFVTVADSVQPGATRVGLTVRPM